MSYLTTKETAEKLGVSTGRVRQMVMNGQLPAEKFGRDLMFNETDIKTVENRKTGRPPNAEKVNEKKAVNKNGNKKAVKTIFDIAPKLVKTLSGKHDNLPSDLSTNKQYLEGLGRD